jgi:hypothetical protein
MKKVKKKSLAFFVVAFFVVFSGANDVEVYDRHWIRRIVGTMLPAR